MKYAEIIIQVINSITKIGVILLYATVLLVFLNANVDYIKEVPQPILLFGIFIGSMAIVLKLSTINWLGDYLSFDKLRKLKNENIK